MSNLFSRRRNEGQPALARFNFQASRISSALLAAFCAASASAEPVQLPAVVVSGTQDAGTLNTLVAIGSNLDLTPLETPASVSVVTRQQLEERGDISVMDAITRAPGYSNMAHPGNTSAALSVRGFTDTASVMRLYDGVRQYGGVGVSFPFDTWSVERIEVLRGPASVIYGEGAIGGVINVVPRKPTRGEIQNEVQFTLGTDNTQRAAFGSGGALDDKWSYRFDISGGRSDGWVDLGDSRDLTFSGALQLDVSPDLRFKLAHSTSRQQPMRYFGTPLINGSPSEKLRDRNYNVGDSHIEYRDHWTELSMEWMPNADTTVRSKLYQIDSNRYWRNAEAYFHDAGTGLIQRGWGTEIRHNQSQVGTTNTMAIKGQLLGLANQVSVGFDVNSSTFKHSNNGYGGVPDPEFVDPDNPVPGHYASADPFIPKRQSKSNQYSVFAEDRLSLSEQWSVIGGLRYDHTDLSWNDFIDNTNDYAKTFSDTGWRLGTVYMLKPDTSIYAQYSEASDPLSSMFFLSPSRKDFKMTTGRQVEVGMKQVLANGRGEWTLALYDIEKKNLLAPSPTLPGVSVPIGKQSSSGVEGSLSLVLAKNWLLDANAALLRARYENFGDDSGNVPTNVPEKVANAWLSWNFMPAWSASTGARYVGARYADAANTLKMPAYTAIDMVLQWQVDSKTSIALRGFNVFDKAYFNTAYYNETQWLYGPGRQVLLTLNHRF